MRLKSKAQSTVPKTEKKVSAVFAAAAALHQQQLYYLPNSMVTLSTIIMTVVVGSNALHMHTQLPQLAVCVCVCAIRLWLKVCVAAGYIKPQFLPLILRIVYSPFCC